MRALAPRHFISLDVSDKPGTAGLIKQRVRARRLVLDWDEATAELAVVLTLAVDLYAAENGQHGVRLANVPAAPVSLHGDNNSAVDPATGVVVLNRENVGLPNEEPLQAWLARVDADPALLELQGDWLAGLLDNPNASIAVLALGQMQAADRPPYNKFSR